MPSHLEEATDAPQSAQPQPQPQPNANDDSPMANSGFDELLSPGAEAGAEGGAEEPEAGEPDAEVILRDIRT